MPLPEPLAAGSTEGQQLGEVEWQEDIITASPFIAFDHQAESTQAAISLVW